MHFLEESSKCARKELANTILKRRRSTLAQVLFGEKEERKREKEEEKHVQDVGGTSTATTGKSLRQKSNFDYCIINLYENWHFIIF